MALTKCLECGGQVSTHADACPHCGFPMAKQKEMEMKASDGWVPPQYEECPVCRSKFDNIAGKCNICGYTVEFERPKPKSVQTATTLPKCPTCGSTNLTKLNATSRAIDRAVFGRLSVEARAQYRCNKCFYLW